MNRLVNEGKIGPSGRDWLVAALDPFHDTQLANLEGWPDVECGASVVRCIKQSMTIKKPAGLPAGNWDCHIVQWPWLTSSGNTFTPTSTRVGNAFSMNATPITGAQQRLGGLQAFGVEGGADLEIMCPVGGTTQVAGTLNIDSTFTKGSGRLIGAGYEVRNTTAELYLQGSVICYREMANARDVVALHGFGPVTAGGNVMTVLNATEVRYPPSNAAEAKLLCGSREWKAEEGMYQVAAFTTSDNPAMTISPCSNYHGGTTR